MKVNQLIASAVISAMLALEAWTLHAVVDLKVQVATLAIQVSTLTPNKTIAAK